MNREEFIKMMSEAHLYDLTQECSIFTPPHPHEKSLEVHFFKRVTGAYGGGAGANGQILNWSNTVGTHLVGETAFHSGARPIADIPLEDLCGPGVVADISEMVSDYSVYTPEMIVDSIYYAQDDRIEITGTKGVIWITRGHGSHGDPAPQRGYACQPGPDQRQLR